MRRLLKKMLRPILLDILNEGVKIDLRVDGNVMASKNVYGWSSKAVLDSSKSHPSIVDS